MLCLNTVETAGGGEPVSLLQGCICLKFPNCISLKLQNTKNTVETAGVGR